MADEIKTGYPALTSLVGAWAPAHEAAIRKLTGAAIDALESELEATLVAVKSLGEPGLQLHQLPGGLRYLVTLDGAPHTWVWVVARTVQRGRAARSRDLYQAGATDMIDEQFAPYAHKKLVSLGVVQSNGLDDRIDFSLEDGTGFSLSHDQDCCESVNIEDINGDPQGLVGGILTQAEETSDDGADTDDGSSTWTFYRFGTSTGSVVIRWLGESNGYYSESVGANHFKTRVAHLVNRGDHLKVSRIGKNAIDAEHKAALEVLAVDLDHHMVQHGDCDRSIDLQGRIAKWLKMGGKA